jgi:hypothetical protein
MVLAAQDLQGEKRKMSLGLQSHHQHVVAAADLAISTEHRLQGFICSVEPLLSLTNAL